MIPLRKHFSVLQSQSFKASTVPVRPWQGSCVHSGIFLARTVQSRTYAERKRHVRPRKSLNGDASRKFQVRQDSEGSGQSRPTGQNYRLRPATKIVLSIGMILFAIARSKDEAAPSWVISEPRKGVTLESLSREHEKITKAWKASPEYRGLARFFEDQVLSNDSIDIASCICLCLGTLSGEGWTSKYRAYDHSMSQLIVFESVVDLLSEC